MPRTVNFKGNSVPLSGDGPKVGDAAPEASLVAVDLSEAKVSSYKGKVAIVSVVPSLDTGICDKQTRRFNEEAGKLANTVVLTISRDLPFAQKRWCGAADAKNVVTLSDFRGGSFGAAYGLVMSAGPLSGLLGRAVLVIGKDGKVKYQELVPEITTEPNYDAAIAAAKAAL